MSRAPCRKIKCIILVTTPLRKGKRWQLSSYLLGAKVPRYTQPSQPSGKQRPQW